MSWLLYSRICLLFNSVSIGSENTHSKFLLQWPISQNNNKMVRLVCNGKDANSYRLLHSKQSNCVDDNDLMLPLQPSIETTFSIIKLTAGLWLVACVAVGGTTVSTGCCCSGARSVDPAAVCGTGGTDCCCCCCCTSLCLSRKSSFALATIDINCSSLIWGRSSHSYRCINYNSIE